MKLQLNKEQFEINKLESFLLNKQQEQNQITQQYDSTKFQLQNNSESIRSKKNSIEDLIEKIQQIKHQLEISDKEIQFYIQQYQDDQILNEVFPLQQRLSKLQSQLKDLQNQRTDIDQILKWLNLVQKSQQKKIIKIQEFVVSIQSEVKKLFSVIWLLKGKSTQFLILFSLFFQNYKFELSFNPSNDLSTLLQVDLQKAEQLNSSIEFNFVEEQSSIVAQIKPKITLSNEELIQLFDKLNQMISTQQVSECCNSIKQYNNDSCDQFNKFLSQFIQDLK
ncbi:hypothetical protein ABPG74_020945 [Tetrahymena malaccensis]